MLRRLLRNPPKNTIININIRLSKARYRCREGYMLEGKEIRSCIRGQWLEKKKPKCTGDNFFFFFLFFFGGAGGGRGGRVYAVSGPGPAWTNNQRFQYFYKNLATYYKPRFNLQDRKNFLQTSFRFHRGIFIKWWNWAFGHVIYTENHVTKPFDRLRGTRNERLCSMLEPEKYFDGLPNASLEHTLHPREDRRGGHIQEGPDNFGWSPTVVVDAVVMTTCSLKLTPKGLSCLQ